MVIVAREAEKAANATVAMEVAAAAGATTTATVIHNHTGEMTTKVTIYNDWEDRGGPYRTSWDRGGRDSWSYGPSASNPRDRDRFITQMMEDERYECRKQNDPDFLGSGASATRLHPFPPE